MQLLLIIIWLALAVYVAILGSKRTIGAGKAFLFAIILSPAIGFIIVAFSQTLSSVEHDKIQKRILQELEAMNGALAKYNQSQQEENTIKDHSDQCPNPVTDWDESSPSVKKPTVWERIKYGV